MHATINIRTDSICSRLEYSKWRRRYQVDRVRQRHQDEDKKKVQTCSKVLF